MSTAPPLDTTPYHSDFGKGLPLSNHDDWGSPAYYANNTWIYNSFSAADAVPTGDSFLYLAYFVLAMSFGIMIHSFYLNRWKMTTIRVCTDAACVCTIVQFFLLFQCASGEPCGQYKTAILVDVLANGFFSAVVQGCDNYITFVRYAAVVGEKRITRTRKILTLTYVIVMLFFCWWPYYWLVPFFVNMNTPTSLFGYTYSQYVWNFPSYIMYNCYHSGLLILEVKRIHSETTLADTSALEIMAWRAIFHDAFSIMGIICYCFVYPIGAALQVMLILFGLHFVFNWKTPTKWILLKTGLVKTKAHAPATSQKSQKSSEPSEPGSEQLGNMSLFTYTYRRLSMLNMNMTRSSVKDLNRSGKLSARLDRLHDSMKHSTTDQTGVSGKLPSGAYSRSSISGRGSFEPGLTPFRPDITPRQSRAMSGNFVLTANDVDRVVRDGQRSARRSLERSGRNSLDNSRRSGIKSERVSQRIPSRKASVDMDNGQSDNDDVIPFEMEHRKSKGNPLNVPTKFTAASPSSIRQNSGKIVVVDHDASMAVEDFEEIDDLPAPLTTSNSQKWREQKTMNFPGAMV